MSGGDRKALRKELTKARGVTLMLARQSEDLRARGEKMIREADKLSCESLNERMWADGEPIDPSPTVDQAINGGFFGLRSNALDAAPSATWTLLSCRTSPRLTSTILPAASDVNGARTQAGGR